MIMTVTSTLDNVLRIATRRNPLTLWQAHYVKDRLIASHPDLVVELVPMVTCGDAILGTPLVKIDGEGLFVKELEVTLLENRADIVVHPMKDMPAGFPQGLGLITICEREDPRDVFVSNTYDSLDALPVGSIAGMSSLRCQCQLAERRSDLIIRSLRGNVGTRLSKLDNGEYDTIIPAVAGLKRLGLGSRICVALPPEIFLPAIGQGAAGIERRLDDTRTHELLAALNHHETTLRVIAERAMNTRFEGECQVPISSYAELTGGEIRLRVLTGVPSGSQIIRGERRGAPQNAEQMGISLVEELSSNGAHEILAEVYNEDTPV